MKEIHYYSMEYMKKVEYVNPKSEKKKQFFKTIHEKIDMFNLVIVDIII